MTRSIIIRFSHYLSVLTGAWLITSNAILQWPIIIYSKSPFNCPIFGPSLVDKSGLNFMLATFLFLFIFKFLKIPVHIISYLCYQPPILLEKPKYYPDDVVVIIPSCGDFDAPFERCLDRVLANRPGVVLISTLSDEAFRDRKEAHKIVKLNEILIARQGRGIDIFKIENKEENKRLQYTTAATSTYSKGFKIIANIDETAWWPNDDFLEHALLPFQDVKVGLVGTAKKVLREKEPLKVFENSFSQNAEDLKLCKESQVAKKFRNTAISKWAIWRPEVRKFFSDDIGNFLGCIYLMRHNVECISTHGVDGGLFVVSGRTCFCRRDLFVAEDGTSGEDSLQHALNNEYWSCFWGWIKIKLPNADDDNCFTRWMYNHGYKCEFIDSPKTTMMTVLGTEDGWTRFLQRNVRWAKTTLRTNTTTLFTDRKVWKERWWSTYAIHINSLTNFNLINDALLFYTLVASGYGSKMNLTVLWGLIMVSKMYKVIPHYKQHPQDVWYIPVQIAFGYFHTFIKLYALLNVTDAGWGSRKGI